MKKLAIAGLLAAALSLTALSGQKAAAWGCDDCGGGGGCCSHSGCWGFGLNFSFTRCGCGTPCLNTCSFCAPCSCPTTSICDAGYGGYAYGGTPSGNYGSYAYGYPVAPAAPMAAPAPTGVQTVGYGYGYAGYAAPSYWYGR